MNSAADFLRVCFDDLLKPLDKENREHKENRGQTTITRLLPRGIMRHGMPERLARDRRGIGSLQLMSSHEYRIKNNHGLSLVCPLLRVK